MALQKVTHNNNPVLKVGLFGIHGSGKTYTAMMLAIGMIEYLREQGLPCKNAIAVFDTENGAGHYAELCASKGIDLYVENAKSFDALMGVTREAEQLADVLMVDSITHPYDEVMANKRKSKGGKDIEVGDWQSIDETYERFRDWYVNAPIHVLLCGRSGNTYLNIVDEDTNKREMYAVGTKMKARGIMYDPALLLEMTSVNDTVAQEDFQNTIGNKWEKKNKRAQLSQTMKSNPVLHACATVIKDRTVDKAFNLMGQKFVEPDFETFLPHVKKLNIGGKVHATDTTESKGLFKDDNSRFAMEEAASRKALTEGIKGLMQRFWPGSTAAEKQLKAAMCHSVFNVHGWKNVEALDFPSLDKGFKRFESMCSQVVDMQAAEMAHSDVVAWIEAKHGEYWLPQGEDPLAGIDAAATGEKVSSNYEVDAEAGTVEEPETKPKAKPKAKKKASK